MTSLIATIRERTRAMPACPCWVTAAFLPWYESTMSETAAKLSVSIPHDLAQAVRRRVGPRGLSGFVARAISHELEREQLGSFLDEPEESAGAVSKKEISRARTERGGSRGRGAG